MKWKSKASTAVLCEDQPPEASVMAEEKGYREVLWRHFGLCKQNQAFYRFHRNDVVESERSPAPS
jgi:hypothetical protein